MGPPRRIQSSCHVEQMFGIGRGSHAAGEDQVVARAFSFDVQTPRRQPDQWVKLIFRNPKIKQALDLRFLPGLPGLANERLHLLWKFTRC